MVKQGRAVQKKTKRRKVLNKTCEFFVKESTPMEERKDDRRVRRTRAQLRRALTELLQEKSIDSLSVTELTSRADVNRGTFY